MANRISSEAKKITWLLGMIYFASYLLRKNFSVMLEAITETGINPVALGAVGSAMTISYGAGQIINGILGDKIKPQSMLTFGLLLATLCNFAMSLCSTVPLMAAVWFVNGFAHAMLWPPIVRLMSTYLENAEYSYAATRISYAASIATILLYVLAPIMLKAMDWRGVILAIAFVGALILVIWMLLNGKAFGDGVKVSGNVSSLAADTEKKAVPLPRTVYVTLLLIFIAISLQGALRDGVGDWMPTFMADAFELDSGSAIITGVIPAVFGIISVYVFEIVHRKFFSNELSCAGAIFAAAIASAVLLLIFNLFVPSGWVSAAISAFLVGFLVACMHGVNLMLITMVPKRFAKSGKVSTVSGFLNSATYVGATVALPLYPALKDNFSWGVTIAVWAAISVLGAVVCFATVPLWKKFRKEYSDNPEV